jgi:exonuclease III
VKRKILKDLFITHHIDFLCLQETKKSEFTSRRLHAISFVYNFWHFLSAAG